MTINRLRAYSMLMGLAIVFMSGLLGMRLPAYSATPIDLDGLKPMEIKTKIIENKSTEFEIQTVQHSQTPPLSSVDGKPKTDAYAPYFDKVIKEIRKHWYLVKPAWRPENPVTESLSARVAFKVTRDGSISDIRLKTPSTHLEFNAFVVQSVQETSPVTPIPEAIKENAVECLYTVHYEP